MRFPVPPRFARIIFDCLRDPAATPRLHSFACCLVAVAATTSDNFRNTSTIDKFHELPPHEQLAIKHQQELQKGLVHAGSDLLTALRVFGVFVARPTAAHCKRYNVVHKTLTEALQLRRQLEEAVGEARREAGVNDGYGGGDANDQSALQEAADRIEGAGVLPSVPSASSSSPGRRRGLESVVTRYGFLGDGRVVLTRDEEVTLRKAIIGGLVDQVARRASVQECTSQGFAYNDAKTSKVPYYDVRTHRIVYVHPTSAVARSHPPPEWVVYCGLVRTRRKPNDDTEEPGVFLAAGKGVKAVAAERTFMKGVTSVTRPWLDQAGFDEEAISPATR